MRAARFLGVALWLAIVALSPLRAMAQPNATAPAVSYARIPGGIVASQAGVSIRVTALTDQILRVRVARGGRWPEDASWAVSPAMRARTVAVRGAPQGFSTKALSVEFGPRLALAVTDARGRKVVADDPDPLRFSTSGFTLRKALPLGEHIFGLGDKTGALDRRGASFVDWNTDAYGFSELDRSDLQVDPLLSGRRRHRWGLRNSLRQHLAGVVRLRSSGGGRHGVRGA